MSWLPPPQQQQHQQQQQGAYSGGSYPGAPQQQQYPQTWVPRPRPPPPTLAAPTFASAHGCCAHRCPDPTVPCCDDCGFGLDTNDCIELPIDCAGLLTILCALGFLAGSVVAGAIGTPSLLSLAAGDASAVQQGICTNVKYAAASNGCVGVLTAGQTASGAACATLGPLFSAARTGPSICEDTAFHAVFLATELADFEATILVLYVAACVATVVLSILVCGRRCCAAEPSAPAPPLLAGPDAQQKAAVTVAGASAPPASAAMSSMTAPRTDGAQFGQSMAPPRPNAHRRPEYGFSTDVTFESAVRVWPIVAIMLDLLILPSILRFASVMPILLSGSTGPLHALLQSFWLKYVASLCAACVVINLPLVKGAVLLMCWCVGGVPWLMYRYAGDTRVMHRVVRDGAVVDDPCEAPCCIMVDMVCCSCLDTFAVVEPPPPAPAAGSTSQNIAADAASGLNVATPSKATTSAGDVASTAVVGLEPPTRVSSPSSDAKQDPPRHGGGGSEAFIVEAPARLLSSRSRSGLSSKSGKRSSRRSSAEGLAGDGVANSIDGLPPRPSKEEKKEKKAKRSSSSKRRLAELDDIGGDDGDLIKPMKSIEVGPARTAPTAAESNLDSPLEVASTAAPSVRSSINGITDATATEADEKTLRRLVRKASKKALRLQQQQQEASTPVEVL